MARQMLTDLDSVLPATAFGREVFAALPIRVQGPDDHQLLSVLDQQRRILKDKITAVASLLRSQSPAPPPDLRKLTDKVKDMYSIIADLAKQSRDLEAKCFTLQREKEELDRLCEVLRSEAEANMQKLRTQAKVAGCKCSSTESDLTAESLRKCREDMDRLRVDYEAAAQHKKVLEEHNARMAAELRVSEERFLSTRSFKRLMKQTQVLMDHVARLKSENEELRKEREDVHDEVQSEVMKVRRLEESRRDDLERRFQDLTFRFEREVMSRQAVQAELEGIRKEQTAIIRLKETESLLAVREAELDSLKRRYKDQRTQREELETKTELDYQRMLDLQDTLALREYQLAALQSAEQPENLTGEAGELTAKLAQYKEEIVKNREIIKKQESEIASLKSRESHTRSKLNSEKTNYKKLIDDVECTYKGYDEAMKQNKQLLQQTKEHDQTVAKIISERISEDRSKHLLEEEAKECKRRAEAQAEVVIAQKTYIQKVEAAKAELEQSLRLLQGKLKEAEGKLRDVEMRCSGELRAHEAVEAAQRQTQEMCREYEKHLIQTATDASQLKFQNSQLTSELLHIRSQMDSLQASSPPSSQDSVLTEELLKLRKLTRCGVCSVRNKELVLAKCFHAFCRRCIEGRLGKERDCPVCRHNFTEMEVKEMWW